MDKFEEKKGVICIQNTEQCGNFKYYKSLAIFSEEKYKKEDIDKITENLNEQEKNKKIKKIFVPEIQLNTNSSLKEEYNQYIAYKNKLNVEILKEKIHKYRPYLKIVKPNITDINNESNILTFILFNPSTANHYELDDTVANCAYLTFEKENNYNGFEILNLFDIRDPKIDLILQKIDKEESVNSEFEYNNITCKKIFLGWGCSNKKYSKKRIVALRNAFSNLYEKFSDKYEELFVLKAPKDGDLCKTWHFGNQCWNRKNLPFKDSICQKITYTKIDKNVDKILILKNGIIQINKK